MQTLSSRWWLAGALVMAAACGPEAVDEQQACLTLTEPEGSSLATSLPARVSLLFGVDTCGGKPVAGLPASAFVLTEDGRRVSDFESQQVVRAQGQQSAMFSVVLLDMSGSLLKSGQFPELKSAAGRYLTAVLGAGAGQQVAVYTFDGRAEPQRVVPFTSDLNQALRGLDTLDVRECSAAADCAGFADRRSCAGWRCIDDSTNLYGAFVSALQQLDAKVAQADVRWKDAALVVFTDGTDQAGRASVHDAFAALSKSTAHLFSVGLGAEVDEAVLRALGRSGYFPASRAEELGQAFTAVADKVTSLANRFYVLDYCSPKRAGTHTLKVTVTATLPDGRVATGGLSKDFDATGFGSGCAIGP